MAATDIDMDSVPPEESENKIIVKETPICENDSNFAVICSFIEQFGSSLDLHLDIAKLKSMLEANETTPEELVELHIKLLRKRRKYIQRDKWERALARFISEYSNVDAWELERYGYKNVNLGIRITAFKNLLEAQFDYNTKFKSGINAMEASALRLSPIGRDIHGNQYWFQLDSELCLRVYSEEPDDEKSWLLICKNKDDLDALISNLRSQNLDQLKDSAPVSENISENEDSNLIDTVVNIKKEPIEDICASLQHQPPDVKLKKIKNEKSDELTELNICDQKRQCIVETESQENFIKLKRSPVQSTDFSSDDSKIHSHVLDDLSNIDSDVRSVLDGILDKISSDSRIQTQPKIEKSCFEVEFKDVIDLCNQLLDQVCANSHQPISSSNLVTHQPEQSPSTASSSSLSLLTPLHTISPSVKKSETFQKQEQDSLKGEKDEKESEDEESKDTITSSAKKRGRKPRRGAKRKAPQNQNDRTFDEKSESESQKTSDLRSKPEPKPRGRRGGGRGRGRRVSIPEMEIIQKAERSPSPQLVKRQSRRIQALQEKKNAELAEKVKREQQLLEEMAKQMQVNKIKSQENSCDSFSRDSKKDNYQTEDSSSDSDNVAVKKRGKKRKRGKKGRPGKPGKAGCPWDSAASSSETSEEEEEEEEIEEEDDEVLQFDDNEDEFACEEPDPDAEPIILKRARTAKKVKDKPTDQESSSEAEEGVNDDTPCQRCGKYDHPEWILLCDKCDAGFHTACLKPPLMLIPDGDWYCPPCENQFLLEKLQEKFESLSKALEKKELEEMRKQRLKQVAVSLDALTKPKPKTESRRISAEEFVKEPVKKYSRKHSDDEESEVDRSDESEEDSDESDYLMLRSARSRKKISYQFTEYDAMINSAILDEGYDEVPPDAPYGQSRGKDMATIENALKQQEAEEREEQLKLAEAELGSQNLSHLETVANDYNEVEEQQEVQNDSDFEPEKPKKASRQLKKRRLNDLEPPSEDDDSDESFKGGSDTEVEDLSEESLEESLGDVTEESNESWKDLKRSKKNRGRRIGGGRSGKKKRGYRRDDFVVDSEDSDYAGGKRSRIRAAARKRVSYKEFTSDEEEEEEEEREWKSKKSKKRKLSGSDTSDEEWEDEDDDDITTKKKKKRNVISEDEEEEEEDEEEEDEEEEVEVEEEEEDEDEDEDEEEEKYDKKTKEKFSRKRFEKTDKKSSKATKLSDEDENDIEEDEEDDNYDEKKAKKNPEKEKQYKKTKSPKVKSSKKFEMRGKPRLSKARMMSLAENSDDSQETKTSPNIEPERIPDNSISCSPNVQLGEGLQPIPSSETVLPRPIVETNPPAPQLVGQRQETNEPQLNIPPIPVSVPLDQRQGPPPVLNMPQRVAPNLMLPSGKPSALSQLTAFASKGPAPPTRMVNPNSNDYSVHHLSHPPSSRIQGSDKDSDYSIMSLDAYGNNPRPLKPSMTGENYCPPTSSPSQLLHLESTQYNPQGPPPHMANMERFPGIPPNNFPPNAKASDPRMPVPYPESIPPRDYHPRQVYPPQPGGFPGDPRGFYDPRLMRPNHGNASPYPHPHPNVHQPNAPYRQRAGPVHYGPNPGPGPGPGQGPGFYSQPGPGFYPRHNPPPRSNNRPPIVPQNLPPTARPTGPHTMERPPPYPGPPHLYPPGHPAMTAHFPPNAFYPHPGEFLPNGGFMIQNLLHAPLPNQPNPANRTNGMEGPTSTGSPNVTPNSTLTNSIGPPAAGQGANHPPPSQSSVSRPAQSAPVSSPSD